MTNRERRDAGLAYISDESIMAEQAECRKILQKLNFMDRSDFAGIRSVVKELLGKSDGAFINPPFYCDYGKHIETGKNFFANYIKNYAFLFIIMAITLSSTYPATDTTAGERERGTLETLLTFPIKSKDIIIGKSRELLRQQRLEEKREFMMPATKVR